MGIFGYRFEIYENVVVFSDNEDTDKSIEMQHHTFKKMLTFYNEARKSDE